MSAHSTPPKNAFERAVHSSFKDWSNNLDKEMVEAEARGELPMKTPEQIRTEASAIWEKAKAINHNNEVNTLKKTVIVNLFAGPGAGKTTCAWAIASELKKRNIETEYVSEYAKECVWDNRTDLLDGSFEHQTAIYEEQNRRVQRLLGKVDVVVTDSPAILSLVYAKEKNSEFENKVLTEFGQQQNFNLFINRGKVFQQAGRVHNLAQSKQLDNDIKNMLRENNIYFGTYYHHTLNVLVNNIVNNLKNVNTQDLKNKTANSRKYKKDKPLCR